VAHARRRDIPGAEVLTKRVEGSILLVLRSSPAARLSAD
jgi:hypothetical protein